MDMENDLQRDVMEELEWEPSLNAAEIGVAAVDGTVTLSGHVSSYAEKAAAEEAVKRVAGVRAVANDLAVEFLPGDLRDDTDLAREAVKLLDAAVDVPPMAVTVSVRDGWITLEGEVPWNYQRDAARRSVRYIRGCKGVTNRIVLNPVVSPAHVQEKIESALARAAAVDAGTIRVDVTAGGRVILHGTVRSWFERQEAERAAWAAPGVTAVENHVALGAPELAAL